MEALCNANAAALGGVVATSITYPVDTVSKKVLMQKGNDSAITIFNAILKEKGVAGLFPGLYSKLGWSFMGKFVFYGSYSLLRDFYTHQTKKALTFWPDLVAGYLAEFSTLPSALPFEAIATKMQTSKGGSLSAAVAGVWNEKGIRGFYKGLSAYPVLCITPAITNAVFSQLKAFFLKSRPPTAVLGTAEAFFLGAVARTVATFIMYPFLRAKTMMQASGNKGGSTNPIVIIMHVIKTQGIAAVYRGLGPELVRGVLSSAVTLMLKEKIYVINRAAFLSMAKPPAAVEVTVATK